MSARETVTLWRPTGPELLPAAPLPGPRVIASLGDRLPREQQAARRREEPRELDIEHYREDAAR